MAKRFYKDVDIRAEADAFVVTLDGRVLKTPGKQPLTIGRKSAAELVAAEWDAQIEEIQPEAMPCTRLMNVACELTPSRRPEMIKEFAAYASTDLLCYRSASPADLAKKQGEQWQPILDWAAMAHNITLLTTTGLGQIAHPTIAENSALAYAESLDNASLTLLLHFTASFGSSVLGLAVIEKYLDVETAYAYSRLDEIHQNSLWGEDEEAADRTAFIGQELKALGALLEA